MKILALIGSRRKKGNSAGIVNTLLATAEAAGAETEILFLGDYEITACTGCEGCSKSWDCIIPDDFQKIIEKIDVADGVVFASPTYWYSVTSDMKRFIDRSYSLIQFPVSRKEWVSKYAGSGKAAVAVAVCEQSEEKMMGNTYTLLHDYSEDLGFEVVASVKGLKHFEAGSVQSDTQLLRAAEDAGKNLVEFLKM